MGVRRTLIVPFGLLVAVAALAACAPDRNDTVNNTAPSAQTDPTDSTVTYSLARIGTLDDAVDLVERDASDAFFFVVSRRGTVERWSRDGTVRTVVLDMSTRTTTDSERGLLGLDFRRTNAGRWEAFASYTNLDGDTRISRFDMNDDGTFTDGTGAAGTVIMSIDQPHANHNGGDIEVGTDNMLYIALGDGGAANDPDRRALNTADLLGKILRINPTTTGYEIPADNPFINVADARAEIWSIGLRNPWRITFDGSGNLWVADVGQNSWEEVTMAPATGSSLGGRGVNFGWSAWEGSHRFNTDVSAPDALMPAYEYPHDDGRCSISGGAVGTDATTPGRDGWYFFGDYCAGRVWAMFVANGRMQAEDVVARGLDNVVAVRAVSSGVYVLSNGGRVSRVVSDARP